MVRLSIIHLYNTTNVKTPLGCMKEVWINHKQVDFGNAKIQQKVQPGCGIIEDTFEDDLQVITLYRVVQF